MATTSVIVKADLETAMQYTSAVSTKISGRRHRVLFEVDVDDYNMVDAVSSARTNHNIVALVYEGLGLGFSSLETSLLDGISLMWMYTVASNVTEQDIDKVQQEVPSGVSLVLKFPEDYTDYDFVLNILQKYPNTRVCGCMFFAFEECKVGVVGKDILSRIGAPYDSTDYLVSGECNAVPTFLLEDVTLDDVAVGGSKKVGKRKSGGNSGNGEPKQKKQKVQKFSNLLFGGGTVEL